MLLSITISLALLATCAAAQPHDIFISTHMSRRTAESPRKDCNATCGAYKDVKKACTFVHCGCSAGYLQAQGECFLCQTRTPPQAAAVQVFLDSEVSQCDKNGIPIKINLQLPQGAQVFVDDYYRQSASLRQQQTIFLALQIVGGHFGLVIVLFHAVFSRKVNRDPTFMNFCITWIFSSVIYSILLYHGTEEHTLATSLGPVHPNVCLAQAALTNGAQVMTACSTMALVIQLWSGLHVAIHGVLDRPKRRRWMTFLFLVMPYVLFSAFAVPSIFLGEGYVKIEGALLPRVLPTNFYCSVVAVNFFLPTVYGVTLGLLIITTIFDVLILNILYQHWRAFHHVRTTGVVSLSLLLRVIVFSIYRVVVAVAYGAVLTKPSERRVTQLSSGNSGSFAFGVQAWVDMLQAAIPLVASLVLGLNADVLSSLMFWRRNRTTMQSYNTNSFDVHMAHASHNITWTKPATIEDAKDVDDQV